MRLFYIANIRLPTEKAHGIQIMKMCEAFGAQGHEVTLLVPTRRNPELHRQDPFEYYGVERRFRIVALRSYDPTVFMHLPGGAYSKVQGVFFALAFLHYAWKNPLSKEVMVYTRDEYLLPFVAFLRRPVVWEGHSLPRYARRYVRYWKRCRGLVVLTGPLRGALTKIGLKREKICVASDGVDLKKFQISNDKLQIREKFGLPLDKKIVMYVGHLYDWKGAGVLLEVAQRITNDVFFVFVGGTEQDIKKFRQKAGEMKLQNVLIVGHRPPIQIPQWLAAADVLVLPNSGRSEISRLYTSPMKLFEYMAAERPIVTSDLPSIREILNEQHAVFVKADDADDLASGITQVLGNEALGERIAEQARRDVEKYDWNVRARNIVKFLSER